MVRLEENTVDAALEKHLPVATRVDGGFKVVVGSVAHPMAEDHNIEWIEVLENGAVHRQFLNPGEAPEAFFALEADSVTARAYCNLHGFWKS
jgi:superoxide reductase